MIKTKLRKYFKKKSETKNWRKKEFFFKNVEKKISKQSKKRDIHKLHHNICIIIVIIRASQIVLRIRFSKELKSQRQAGEAKCSRLCLWKKLNRSADELGNLWEGIVMQVWFSQKTWFLKWAGQFHAKRVNKRWARLRKSSLKALKGVFCGWLGGREWVSRADNQGVKLDVGEYKDKRA